MITRSNVRFCTSGMVGTDRQYERFSSIRGNSGVKIGAPEGAQTALFQRKPGKVCRGENYLPIGTSEVLYLVLESTSVSGKEHTHNQRESVCS